jgi:hypothetical protein
VRHVRLTRFRCLFLGLHRHLTRRRPGIALGHTLYTSPASPAKAMPRRSGQQSAG